MFLQIAFMSLSSKLHLANCHLFILQSAILQTIIYLLANSHLPNYHLVNYAFSFQCWAVKYGLIARGVDMDLRSFSTVKAHFNGLSSDKVSKDSAFSYHFFCMFPRILLLNLCVATGHMEYLGKCTSCCGSCFGSGCPHYF